MNYSKQIFEMLGVELGEEFKLNNGWSYCLDKDLNLWYRNPDWTEGRFETADYSIKDILNGAYKIIKLQKKIAPTKKEQVAIDYARLCGYKYLAKDKDGGIYAYLSEPYKNKPKEFWSAKTTGTMQIRIPISFLSWEDDEPYYIGGEER